MVVTFCGHREVMPKEDVRLWLYKKVEKLIHSGVNTFALGGYGEFDLMAESVVWELKKKYPKIKMILVLPYQNNKIYKKQYDGVLYPNLGEISKQYAIVHRNRWMVEWSDIVVAYVIHKGGGAFKTLEYAKKKKKITVEYDCWFMK